MRACFGNHSMPCYVVAMEGLLIIAGAASVGWFLWKFFSGLTSINAKDKDTESNAVSDGTWLL